MSENTNTPDVATPETETNEPAVKTWAKTLEASEKARVSAEKNGKKAGILLWDGAVGAITEWDKSSDPDGSTLYDEVKDALGGDHRKGDASKIKTVAMAVANHGLDLNDFPNLSKAYKAASDLTKGAPQRKEEDDAADEATSAIEVPAKPSTPEDAAKIVLAKGVDDAARLLVATLGRENGPAHRALIRAMSAEITGVAKALAEEKKAAEKAQREADKAEAGEKIQQAKAAKAEAKQAEPKAKPKAAPVKSDKPKAAPVKKAAPKVAAPKVETPKVETPKAEAAPAKAKPNVAKPVRRPVRPTK